MTMRNENINGGTLGKPKRITIHWTAGNYTQTYDHYHYCIKGDGTVVNTLPLDVLGSHTWKRNSNNIGISMCCMANKFPPTKKQIEATAKLVTELMVTFDIPMVEVEDHFYYAKLDGYSNLRWDTGSYTKIIKDKAKWYKEQIGKPQKETLKQVILRILKGK